MFAQQFDISFEILRVAYSVNIVAGKREQAFACMRRTQRSESSLTVILRCRESRYLHATQRRFINTFASARYREFSRFRLRTFRSA